MHSSFARAATPALFPIAGFQVGVGPPPIQGNVHDLPSLPPKTRITSPTAGGFFFGFAFAFGYRPFSVLGRAAQRLGWRVETCYSTTKLSFPKRLCHDLHNSQHPFRSNGSIGLVAKYDIRRLCAYVRLRSRVSWTERRLGTLVAVGGVSPLPRYRIVPWEPRSASFKL